MKGSEIIFQNAKKSIGKASRIRAFFMLAVVFKTSATYLTDVLLGKGGIEQADKRLKIFARDLFSASNTTLVVNNREKFQKDQAYVVMSNHPSIMDIPTLFAAVPGSLRMVFKQQLTKYPIFGTALIKAGFIPVDRAKKFKAIQQLGVAKQRIKEGVSVWLAPEGTRSRSTEMHPFKKGGFHLAVELGAPIVPAWIEGGEKVVKPDSIVVCPNQTITVTFGSPIETTGITKEGLPALMSKVRTEILKLRSESHR